MAETINTVDALQGLMRLEKKFNEKAEGHAAIAVAAHLAADKIREQGITGDVSIRDTLQTLMRIERDFNQKAEGCQNLAEAALMAADKIRELDEENRALKKAAKGIKNS
jgi:hypothetical protein